MIKENDSNKIEDRINKINRKITHINNHSKIGFPVKTFQQLTEMKVEYEKYIDAIKYIIKNIKVAKIYPIIFKGEYFITVDCCGKKEIVYLRDIKNNESFIQGQYYITDATFDKLDEWNEKKKKYIYFGKSIELLSEFLTIKENTTEVNTSKLINECINEKSKIAIKDVKIESNEISNNIKESIIDEVTKPIDCLETENKEDISVKKEYNKNLHEFSSGLNNNINNNYRQIFISERFRKDVSKIKDKDLMEKIISVLESLSQVIQNNPEDVNEYLKKLTAKKFKNESNYWKFYITYSHRIIYAYGKDIDKHEYRDSLFILRYVFNHDEQGRLAQKAKSAIGQTSYNIFENEVDDDIKLDFDEYDIDREVTYKAVPGKIKELMQEKFPNAEVLLNSEQQKCIQAIPPMIFKGNAGSGKTLVSIEIMKIISNNNEDALYLTFTDGLCKLAKNQYELLTGLTSNRFFSIYEFCLLKLNLFRYNFVNFYEFELWYKERYYNLNFNPLEVWAEIRGIIKGYMEKQWDRDLCKLNLISEEVYYSLSDTESKYDLGQRKNIYSIAKRYQEWLTNNDRYDDNDLAQKIINNLSIGLINKYDAIIVDEIQDLTEVQIVMLLQLSKNYNLYLSGDPNQIINPTFFSFERLSTLFFLKRGVAPIVYSLKYNYRSCNQIVEYINSISDKRKILIGNQKREDDLHERAMRNDTYRNRLINVTYNEDNIRRIIELYEESPNSAVIVFDDKEKAYIKQLIGKDLNCIFTIFEIKGLEFNHVLCFNLFSSFQEKWHEIFSFKGRRSTEHRFYFNVFYVAITRAREYVCFIEKEYNNPSFKSFIPNLELVTKVDEENIYLNNKYLPEEWYEEAVKYERTENFDRAINSYKKYNLLTGNENDSDVKRCEALKLFYYGKITEDYNKAGQIFIDIGNWDMAEKCYKETKNDSKLLEVHLRKNQGKNMEEVNEQINFDFVITCIDKNYEDKSFMNAIEQLLLIPKIEDHNYICEYISDIEMKDLLEVK